MPVELFLLFLRWLEPPAFPPEYNSVAPVVDALDACCNYPSEEFRTTPRVEGYHRTANPKERSACFHGV